MQEIYKGMFALQALTLSVVANVGSEIVRDGDFAMYAISVMGLIIAGGMMISIGRRRYKQWRRS